MLTSMMSPGGKKWLIGTLTGCFLGQTTVVYSDDSDWQLSGDALAGARLWHEGNCQSCHQLYGFGGFLGPDLTNVATRLGSGLSKRVAQVTTDGPGQMPAYGHSTSEVAALTAFLVEVDRTGIGQARMLGVSGGDSASDSATPDKLIAARVTTAEPAVARGYAIVQSRPCMACHQVIARGINAAPPLAAIVEKIDDTGLDNRLRHGRPPMMPAPSPAFDEGELADVKSYLRWLGRARDQLEAEARPTLSVRELDFGQLPWWEYR